MQGSGAHAQPYLTLLVVKRSAPFPKQENILKERWRSLQPTSKPDEKRDRYRLLGRTVMEIGTSRGSFSINSLERKLKPHTAKCPRFLCRSDVRPGWVLVAAPGHEALL